MASTIPVIAKWLTPYITISFLVRVFAADKSFFSAWQMKDCLIICKYFWNLTEGGRQGGFCGHIVMIWWHIFFKNYLKYLYIMVITIRLIQSFV